MDEATPPASEVPVLEPAADVSAPASPAIKDSASESESATIDSATPAREVSTSSGDDSSPIPLFNNPLADMRPTVAPAFITPAEAASSEPPHPLDALSHKSLSGTAVSDSPSASQFGTFAGVPSETFPSASVPSESVPSEAIPSEAIPSESVPSEIAPSEIAPSEIAPSEAVAFGPSQSVSAPPARVSPDNRSTSASPVAAAHIIPIPRVAPNSPNLGTSGQDQSAEEPTEPKPQIDFWRKPWVQNVLPLGTSLALHLGILLIGFLTYQAATKLVETVKQQVIIPDSVLATDGQAGGIPNPGLGGDPNRAAEQDTVQDTPANSTGLAEHKNDALSDALQSGAAGDVSADAVLGIGGNRRLGSVGAGKNLANGGGGAELAPWGIPGGGGGAGPKCNFLGSGGNAISIAFVCDASGSMLTKMDLLKLEMGKTIRGLQPIQDFNVFFFHGSREDGNKTYDAFSSAMLMANPNAKQKLYAWLQAITPRGETYVIPALTTAFNMRPRPQLIYLLTDGAFEEEGGPAVVDAIDKLNADRSVHVNTILLIASRKDMDTEDVKTGSETMKSIADKNGGVFHELSVEDF
jgi:hypothetical protein